jgi:hypothetical protein
MSVLEKRASREADDSLVDLLTTTAEHLGRSGLHGPAALVFTEASFRVALADPRRSDLLGAALHEVEEVDPDKKSARFLSADWAAPKRIRERVRLHAVLSGLAEDRQRWLTDALDASPSTDRDADRLAAALVGDWLAGPSWIS